MPDLVPTDIIARKILIVRGRRVMLDRDLALLYEVKTSVLNQAVKRNISRFPEDFMFSLSREENHEDITICDILKVLQNCIRLF